MTETDLIRDFDQARRMHRAMWATGDYARVAEQLTGVSAAVVGMAAIRPGLRVLDLGAGSGNTAILAAGRDAEVTAADLTDDLFGVARRRAANVGVTITWAEVNPEDLPFPAGHFDRVLSAVGGPLAMARNPGRVAAEMARVARPGGMLVLASWTAEGIVGQVARLIAGYLPPPSPDAPSPWAWAQEDTVQAMLGPLGFDLTLARRTASLTYSSPSAYIEYLEEVHGPTMLALRRAEAQHRRADLRARLLDLYSRANHATDGTLAFAQEYLLVTASVGPAHDAAARPF